MFSREIVGSYLHSASVGTNRSGSAGECNLEAKLYAGHSKRPRTTTCGAYQLAIATLALRLSLLGPYERVARHEGKHLGDDAWSQSSYESRPDGRPDHSNSSCSSCSRQHPGSRHRGHVACRHRHAQLRGLLRTSSHAPLHPLLSQAPVAQKTQLSHGRQNVVWNASSPSRCKWYRGATLPAFFHPRPILRRGNDDAFPASRFPVPHVCMLSASQHLVLSHAGSITLVIG
jgi:hypothetical protein